MRRKFMAMGFVGLVLISLGCIRQVESEIAVVTLEELIKNPETFLTDSPMLNKSKSIMTYGFPVYVGPISLKWYSKAYGWRIYQNDSLIPPYLLAMIDSGHNPINDVRYWFKGYLFNNEQILNAKSVFNQPKIVFQIEEFGIILE